MHRPGQVHLNEKGWEDIEDFGHIKLN